LALKAGLPVIRLHDLRHTNASLALSAGVDLKVVSERLGHSQLAITADLYTHVNRGLGKAAAEQIAVAVTWYRSMLVKRAHSAPTDAPTRQRLEGVCGTLHRSVHLRRS
jgi:Site-specific recombinase XerD